MKKILIERNYPADNYLVWVQSGKRPGLELVGVVPTIEAGRRMLVETGLRKESEKSIHSIHDIGS